MRRAVPGGVHHLCAQYTIGLPAIHDGRLPPPLSAPLTPISNSFLIKIPKLHLFGYHVWISRIRYLSSIHCQHHVVIHKHQPLQILSLSISFSLIYLLWTDVSLALFHVHSLEFTHDVLSWKLIVRFMCLIEMRDDIDLEGANWERARGCIDDNVLKGSRFFAQHCLLCQSLVCYISSITLLR